MPSDYGASIKLNLPGLQNLEKIGSVSLIGIKRMGELDSKPLYSAAREGIFKP